MLNENSYGTKWLHAKQYKVDAWHQPLFEMMLVNDNGCFIVSPFEIKVP